MQEILDVSATLFAESGYKATTVDAIADRLNLNKATIYHYFDAKSDILFQIIWSIIADSIETSKRVDREESAVAAVNGMLSGLVRRSSKDKSYFKVYFQENTYFQQHFPPDQYAIIRGSERKITKMIYNVLKKGIDRGEIVPCNVKYVGRLTMALALAPYGWRENVIDVEEVMQAIRLICFKGIAQGAS